MSVKIKRVYDAAEPGDGYRVLIDRMWPRGVSRERARLDEWARELAPSSELRKWFNHVPERFDEPDRDLPVCLPAAIRLGAAVSSGYVQSSTNGKLFWHSDIETDHPRIVCRRCDTAG